jgi:acetyl-CoA carboxylase biotin carboxyl carrier protein
MQISLEQLEALLKTLDDKKVAEFEYEDESIRLRVALGRGAAPIVAGPIAGSVAAGAAEASSAARAAEAVDPNVAYVTSPFVGTFYRAASPDADNFVESGASVKKGQTLCIIEAMKLMNEIDAEYACTILEILVENGKSVEFGQKLFKVRKA